MALRAVLNHPKFADLKRLLGNAPRSHVLGYLEAIWQFNGLYTPQGDIGRYTDLQIESWLEWPGQPGALIAAMIEARWLDKDQNHRMLVHDWCDHADKATRQTLKRKNIDFVRPTPYRSSTVKPESGTPFPELSTVKPESGTPFPELSTVKPESGTPWGLSGAGPDPGAGSGPGPCPEPGAVPVPVPGAGVHASGGGGAGPPCGKLQSPEPEDPEILAHQLVEELARSHPTPGNIASARFAAARIIADAANPHFTLAALRKSHQAYTRYWAEARKLNPRCFIPQLSRWFGDGDCLHPPPEAAADENPPKEESVLEMARRKRAQRA